VSLESFNKDGVVRGQINIGTDVPNKDINISSFWKTMRIEWAKPKSTSKKEVLAKAIPGK
jgi:hypothetical protein